jgi:hypothetical protein
MSSVHIGYSQMCKYMYSYLKILRINTCFFENLPENFQ